MNHGADTTHEDLLDVFRAAALSVTKLYKTSASAQAKARIDGYQDCLEDLLAVIDKGDVDLRTVRWWITERLEGREPILPTIESEDEVDKTDVASASGPGPQAATAAAVAAAVATPGGRNTKADRRQNTDVVMQTDQDTPPPAAARRTGSGTPPVMPSAAVRTGTPAEMPTDTARKLRTGGSGSVKGVATTGAATTDTTTTVAPATAEAAAAAAAPHSSESDAVAVEPTEVTVPMQDVFTFRSTMPYPPSESYLELANLDLSDRRSVSATSDAATSGSGSPPASHSMPSASSASPSSTRPFRVRHGAARSGLRSTALPRHGRNAAGQKRKLNFDEIFDLASIGYGKDMFGRGGNKRSRQT